MCVLNELAKRLNTGWIGRIVDMHNHARKLRWFPILLGVLLFAAALNACSDSMTTDVNPTPTPTATDAPIQAPSDTP